MRSESKNSFAFIPAVALLLSGCTLGPDYVQPSVLMPAAFKEAPVSQKTLQQNRLTVENWWSLFNDPELSALLEQIDVTQPALAQAEAQYRQAQAVVQSAMAAFSPIGGASMTGNRFRASSGQSVAVSGVKYLFGFALNATWEPDIWGSIRRQVESDRANAQASAATLQALTLSLRTTLAQAYFQLRITDAQKRLLDNNAELYRETQIRTQNRYRAGVSGKTDVLQAEMQTLAADAQAKDLGIVRSQLEHAIAVTLGKAPAQFTLAAKDDLPVVPLIPTGVPSSLLSRRPDIVAAERTVAAANAKIGVAKAAFFPALSLSATNGWQSNNLSNLFAKATRYWALGPAALAYTFFDGGAKNAQLKQAASGYDSSVAAYRQTVLTAFQEVEDNLSALRILNEEIAIQRHTITNAMAAVRLTDNQYQAGTVGYLNVLTAQSLAYSHQQRLLDLEGKKLNAAVLLIKALGGGWDSKAMPNPKEVAGEIKWYEFFALPLADLPSHRPEK